MELDWDRVHTIKSGYTGMMYRFYGDSKPSIQTDKIIPLEVKLRDNILAFRWVEKDQPKIAYMTDYSRSNFYDIWFELKYSEREKKPIEVELVYPRENSTDPIFLWNLSYIPVKKTIKSLTSLAYIALVKGYQIYAPDIKVKIRDVGTLTDYETV